MQKRNRHLVDNSSLCISYLTSDSGGTAYTVNYAKAKGLKIINLAELYAYLGNDGQPKPLPDDILHQVCLKERSENGRDFLAKVATFY